MEKGQVIARPLKIGKGVATMNARFDSVASAVLKSSILSDEFPECVYGRARSATAGALPPSLCVVNGRVLRASQPRVYG